MQKEATWALLSPNVATSIMEISCGKPACLAIIAHPHCEVTSRSSPGSFSCSEPLPTPHFQTGENTPISRRCSQLSSATTSNKACATFLRPKYSEFRGSLILCVPSCHRSSPPAQRNTDEAMDLRIMKSRPHSTGSMGSVLYSVSVLTDSVRAGRSSFFANSLTASASSVLLIQSMSLPLVSSQEKCKPFCL